MASEAEFTIEEADEAVRVEAGLRPTSLGEYVGQESIREHLRIAVEAARSRDEPLDHVLLAGPPGLGKTSLAHILAREMQGELHATSGPVIEKAGDLAAILTALGDGDVLFVDEIHRLGKAIEEILYPAMEDRRIDLVIGEGPSARSISLDLARFTLVGATTRSGMLSSPLRSRFGTTLRLDFYSDPELARIVLRSAGILRVSIDGPATKVIASRSRGTPRVANRLLRWLRDYAVVEADGDIDRAVAEAGLEQVGVDAAGFDAMDRRLLQVLVEKFDGGPVGLDTLAAALGEDAGTLEEVHEPYLIRKGFLARTPRGRTATLSAYQHLGIQASRAAPGLFDSGGHD